MYFNHATAGALVVKPIIDKYEDIFSEKEKTVLWFLGVTAAVLPDFDLTYAVLTGLTDHRSFITHGFFLYIIAFLIIYFLSLFQKKGEFGKKFFEVAAPVFLAGVATHFVIDFFMGGTALFAPFSYKVLGFDMQVNGGSENRLKDYILSKYMILEISLTLLFFYFLKGKKYFTAKLFALFYMFIATLSFIAVSLSFF